MKIFVKYLLKAHKIGLPENMTIFLKKMGKDQRGLYGGGRGDRPSTLEEGVSSRAKKNYPAPSAPSKILAKKNRRTPGKRKRLVGRGWTPPPPTAIGFRVFCNPGTRVSGCQWCSVRGG